MSNEQTKRFGVSLSQRILNKFDRKIEKEGYDNRSEAIRDLIRDSFLEAKIEDDEEVAGTLTFIIDHNFGETSKKLEQIYHEFHEKVISKLRVPLDDKRCLEVVVLIGKSQNVKTISSKIRALRGVKHGNLTFTYSGKK